MIFKYKTNNGPVDVTIFVLLKSLVALRSAYLSYVSISEIGLE